MHCLLALPAVLDPRAPIRQRARGASLLGDGNELLERRLRIRNDSEVRGEDAADLGRFDVDVNETSSPPVGVQPTGVAVGPPVTDSENEIGCEHCRVAVAMGRLQSDHACRKAVIVWNAAPTHERRHHRDIEDLRQLDQ